MELVVTTERSPDRKRCEQTVSATGNTAMACPSKHDGCLDIDIWPAPSIETFSIRRKLMAVDERRECGMAWMLARELMVRPQLQAYTRLADQLYLFENLEGSGLPAELPVGDEGIVLDYRDRFPRVEVSQ